ncbi:hypothetical protein IV203_015560 [Nitzschia inconspicua]|uniref:Uncharacterized protein n=1 Tax=Nitzschia inconspicua TaxID=303405 RepID=A0A9K3LCW2_9STRA|nr:hypothetical protein IV203_015560 [Nitzschia inconspicua]
MLRISTSAEATGDGHAQAQQLVEGRSPSQSPANSQNNDDADKTNPPVSPEVRIGVPGIDDIAAAANMALQQSMMFDREAEEYLNHSTASASLASPTRLEKLRTNQELIIAADSSQGKGDPSQQQLQQSTPSSPLSPDNQSTASSRPDDEFSTTDEPLSAKRLFLQEEPDGVEIHQPFSYDDASIGELAEFLTPQDEEEDVDEDESDGNVTEPNRSQQNQSGSLPLHEKILFEERISQLHQQLAAVEAERDALLIKDHKQIQDMYQDPYASPMKQDISATSGSSPNISNPTKSPIMVPAPSFPFPSKQYSQEQVDELHKKVLELQTHIDELKNKQHVLEQSKRRLKLALKSVENHDKQKSDLLETLSRELGESTARESTLRIELDSCRVKLQGFEMAQAHLLRKDGDDDPSRSPSDVATALVVSEKQNQALQAYLDELQAQNQSYQNRIAELQKEILPKGDKEKQLYSRYVEMKASLSSLAGVLEEVNSQNQMLNARVIQLESEMKGTVADSDAVVIPTFEESEKLQSRVHELEQQVESLMETEKMHNIRCRELEAAIESLESSSCEMTRTDSTRTPVPTYIDKEELQERVKELRGIVHNMSQGEHSCKESIEVLERSGSNFKTAGSKPTKQGVRLAATSSAESSSDGNNLGMSSSSTATAESTSEQVLESTSAAWTSAGSSDDLLQKNDPLTRELELCKRLLENERRHVSTLSKELKLSKSREAEFKTAIEKLTEMLQSANSDKKRAKLRAELDSLKNAMEVAARESNQLLGEMENLLTSTQQELRKEQSKSKDLEAELGNIKDQQQHSETKSWDQPTPSENSMGEDNQIDCLKLKNVTLKKELKALKCQSAKLETILAQTKEELAREQQKVAVMSQEATNRRNLEDRLESTRNELSSFNILDILSPTIPSPVSSSREVEDLRVKNKALESEIASLKTEMQKELNRIKREVISLNSQEMEKEREENELQQQNSALQSENLMLKATLEETKKALAQEQIQVQRLNGKIISLQMEVDSQLDGMTSSQKDEILSKDKEIEQLNDSVVTLRTELDALRTEINNVNETAADREEEIQIAHAELAEERKRNADLSANIASLRSEVRSVDDMALDISALRSELCNLKGDMEIAEQENSDLKDQKRKLEDTLMTAKKDMEFTSERLSQVMQSNAALQAEVEVLRSDVKASTDGASYQKIELSASLASCQKELESERQKLSEVKSANSALQKAVDALQKNLDSLNAQADANAKEKKEIEIAFKNMQEDLEQQLAVERQEIESFKIANIALERDATNRREEAKNATALLAKTKNDIAKLQSEFAVSKLKLNELTLERDDLQDQLETGISDLKQTKSLLQTTEVLKSELEVKLDEINECLVLERQRVESLEAEKMSLQARLKALEDDVEKIVAEKEDTMKSLNRTINDLKTEQHKSKELKEALDAANHEIDSFSQKLDSVVAEKIETANSLSETKKKLTAEEQELQRTLNAKSELESNLSEAKCSLEAANARVAELSSTLTDSEKALEHEQTVVQELSTAMASVEGKRDELDRQLNASADRVTQLEAMLAETNNSLQSHKLKVEELSIEGISLRAELNSLQGHVETTNTRASMVTDHKAELEHLLSTTKGLLEAERQKVQELQSSNVSLLSSMESLKIEMSTLGARFKQLLDEKVVAESELKDARESFAEEKTMCKHLKMELSSLKHDRDDLKSSLESSNARANLVSAHKDELETLLQTTKELLEGERKKVEDVSGLQRSLQSQLAECQKERAELKREVESAFSRANFASKKKDELEIALASIEEQRQQAIKRSHGMNATNTMLRSELENLREDFEKASAQAIEIKEMYEGLLTESKSELTRISNELDCQKLRMEEHVKANEILQAECNKLRSEQEREYSKFAETKQKLEAKLQESKEKLVHKQQLVEDLKQKNNDLEADLNKTRCDLKNISEKAMIAEGDYGSQLASSKWELIAEQQKVEELVVCNKSLEEELLHLRQRLAIGENDVKKRCTEVEQDLESAEQRLTHANDIIVNLEQQIHSLNEKLAESEVDCQKFHEEAEKRNAEVQTVKEEAEKKQSQLEALLLAAREDLLKEQLKVEEYSKLESSMQFELDSLKEAMHQTVTTDREKTLSSLREELEVEKEKVAELTKGKLSLQSKLRVLQQAKDTKKANDFVQERETDMMLATTKQELEIANQSNEELQAKIRELEIRHKQSIAAAEKDFGQKLEDYRGLEEDLKKSEALNAELTQKIDSLDYDAAKLREEIKAITVDLETKEKSILELASVKEELLLEKKRSESLASDKLSLETQLRVAKYAAENANASAGVRVWETEMMLSNTKKELEEALSHNSDLSKRISTLESALKDVEASHEDKIKQADEQHNQSKMELAKAVESIKEMSAELSSLQSNTSSLAKEKESLLERMASLARRDQIQKASLATSNEEINRLQTNIQDFEERFQFLADQLKDYQSKNTILESEKENIQQSLDKKQGEWELERLGLQGRIESLERDVQDSRDTLESVRIECNNIQSREAEMQTNFDSCREELKTLKTLKERWNSERNMLTQRIHDLTSDLEEGAEAVDVARRESIVTAQKMLEEQQSQWDIERESLQERITALDQTLISTRDKLRNCKEELIGRDEKIKELQTMFQAKLSSMEEEMLDARVALQNSEHNVKECLSKQVEVQGMLEAQSVEFLDCKNQLSSEKSRIAELQSIITDKDKDIELLMEQITHHEERVQGLQTEKDRLSEELANNLRQAVKNSEHERSLKKVESDLDEAQIREGILESMLSDCKKELNVCKEELEQCKKEVFDEKYCNGVYKELISKLNRANDSLEQKNKTLTEENDNLRRSSATNVQDAASQDRSPMDDDDFLQNQKERFTAEISSMDHQLRTLVAERDSLKTAAISLQEKVDSLQQTNKELQGMVEKLEVLQAEGSKEQFERLEAELVAAQKALAEVSNKAKGMRHNMSQEIEAAKAKEVALTKEVQSLKASNEAMEKRLEEQEKELDEFEQDFAMARDDARKVVEELRSQVQQLERRNQQLTGDNTVKKVDELKNKLRQLISQNQRLQKDIEGFKSREKKLQRELGLGGWK